MIQLGLCLDVLTCRSGVDAQRKRKYFNVATATCPLKDFDVVSQLRPRPRLGKLPARSFARESWLHVSSFFFLFFFVPVEKETDSDMW